MLLWSTYPARCAIMEKEAMPRLCHTPTRNSKHWAAALIIWATLSGRETTQGTSHAKCFAREVP